jgi:hypothetical protein
MTDTSNAETSADKTTAADAAPDFMALLGTSWKAVETLDAFSKSVLQRLQEDRQAELELGLALLKCAKPTDAFVLYSQFAARRAAAMIDDGPKFARLWANLYGFPPPEAKPAPSKSKV